MLLPALLLVAAAAPPPADLVVVNARVLTVNPAAPTAAALAVTGGRLVAVGADADVRALAGPRTKVADLGGKTVCPGFVDAHCHPSPAYHPDDRWAVVELAPPAVGTMDALVAALKAKAARTPKGQPVIGSRYDDGPLGRHPTRHDLDKASTDHPIVVSHSSGHLSACNTLALALAKVTRATPDPAGGEYERDAAGEPTGLLKETAAGPVRRALPETPQPPRDEVVAGYRRRFAEFHRAGITAVHVAGTSPAAADLMAAAAAGDTPIGLYVMLREGDAAEAGRRQAGPPGPARFGPVKIFHGNSLSGRTCWLSTPYLDRAGYFGIPPARSQMGLNELVGRLHAAGRQVCVHANGDREIDMVVTAFEAALAAHPRRDHRHRVEHCSVVTPDLLRRIKAAGLVVAPHSYVFQHGEKMEPYGADRWEWMHAARAMLDLGIPIAGNSDYPVSAAAPFAQIQSMVTRRADRTGKVYGATQRTTAAEALAAWTRGGAFAGFDEAERGSLEVGKRADFLILSQDPTACPADRIRDTRMLTTVVGGRVVAGADPVRK